MRIGEVLRKWRIMSELSTRQVAEDIGISFATLNRVENGSSTDAKTIGIILTWLLLETAGSAPQLPLEAASE